MMMSTKLCKSREGWECDMYYVTGMGKIRQSIKAVHLIGAMGFL
jgi:hypothetical protein